MIEVNPIPVDLDPARLARRAGVDRQAAADFWSEISSNVSLAGCFDELAPGSLLGPPPGDHPWEPLVIVGICGIAWSSIPPTLPSDQAPALWAALPGLLLLDGLDFLEYRVGLFLKPTGRQPGPRLIPGCPDLPLAANGAILAHFGPERTPGLTLTSSGEIEGGVAFVHPTGSRPPGSGCAGCRREGCPARL